MSYKIENPEVKAFLEDAGFIIWEDVPSWAIELADRMINLGWKKS